MPHIVIVSNSALAVDKIIDIRSKDKDSSITLFCTEGVLPYSRELLPSWLAHEIKEVKLHPQLDKFFADNRVDIITNEKLARISVKRRHVTTESKRQISYDRLILIDTGVFNVPALKGHQKQGVFDAVSFTSIKKLAKQLIDIETVFVNVTNFQGLNVACALRKLNKEVIICAPQGLMANIFDDETGSLLKQILEGDGVRVIDSAIEEILGDSDVKAVRLQSGKVMAASAVIFDETTVEKGMLSEPQLPEGDQLLEEASIKPLLLPIEPTHFGLDILDGYAVGITCLPEGGREYLRFNGPQNIFKKVYAVNDQLVGAILYNAPDYIQPLTQIILNKETIAGREETLLGI